MAFYVKTQAPTSNQLPLLQAKPAIITSALENDSCSSRNKMPNATGGLAKMLEADLKFAQTNHERKQAKNNYEFKMKLVEDEVTIKNQNISNQMRQAAVMAAVASQQRVRLSAKERLALTAKRPTTEKQIESSINGSTSASVAPTKAMPLPTLETLLAVQRQLQQHTKQHLNSKPQTQNEAAPKPELESKGIAPQTNKPLPPSPPKSPISTSLQSLRIASNDTYDKDLPPIPSSVSPSTESSDDSQMNSLESHQSSPGTSLVSIPPPPPPISSYLEQYDEVNSCRSQCPAFNCSSKLESIARVSPVVKGFSEDAFNLASEQLLNRQLPIPTINQAEKPNGGAQIRASALPCRVSKTNSEADSGANIYANFVASDTAFENRDFKSHRPEAQDCSTLHHAQPTPNNSANHQFHDHQHKMAPSPQTNPSFQPQVNSDTRYIPQVSYEQHKFHMQAPAPVTSGHFVASPAEATLNLQLNTLTHTGAGFDEMDSGGIRFPTPPPLDLFPDNEDEDFQCKIPTPPPHKPIHDSAAAAAAFSSSILCQQQQQHLKQFESCQFNSSSFTASHASDLQPPPLFRQQKGSQLPPQLTVRINNSHAGLLSAAGSSTFESANHYSILLDLAASSSSPSSSSDGDGQSNSSSSTSGIHSSIDSPSSSSSNFKLDDLSYGNSKLMLSNRKHDSAADCKSVAPGAVPTALRQAATTVRPARPALKQKKSVSFSDKVELVACADEQSEDHLPNPLLARVLAGKLQ